MSAGVPTNITTATTTTVHSGAGVLKSIIVNEDVLSSVITIYDNTAASGLVIGTITAPATLLQTQYQLDFNCAFNVGLTIVTSTAQDLTVVRG